jgi:hypothetical protein
MRGEPIIKSAVVVLLWGLAVNVSTAKYSGGTGEPNDPYRIGTPNDLNDIGNHVEDFNKHFVMVNDINLAAYTGDQFNIIAGVDCELGLFPFRGVFDGNGFEIVNFTYATDRFTCVTDPLGLFGYVADPNAEIKNLGLVNADINDTGGYDMPVTSYGDGSLVGTLDGGTISGCYARGCRVSGDLVTGALVGVCEKGNISNCHVTNGVSQGFLAGGLVGHNIGTVSLCSANGSVYGYPGGGLVGENKGNVSKGYFRGTVSGQSWIGGVVGNNGGTVSECYVSGTVSGQSHLGGLTGENDGDIANCYAAVAVTGNIDVGGLIGLNDRGTISYCYATGTVDGNTHAGGFVGYDDPERPGDFIGCFWDSDANPDVNGIGNGSDPNVIGKTTAQMKTESTFTDAGWDFVEVWGVGENQTYPFLRVHPAGDLNHDGKVDWLDVAILAGHWLEGWK